MEWLASEQSRGDGGGADRLSDIKGFESRGGYYSDTGDANLERHNVENDSLHLSSFSVFDDFTNTGSRSHNDKGSKLTRSYGTTSSGERVIIENLPSHIISSAPG